MKKIKEILLVDDSKGTNSLNKMLLSHFEVAEKITSVLSGELALDYLKTSVESRRTIPDLIFLDFNMPVMDGLQFLEAYDNLEEDIKPNKIIVLLSSFMRANDIERVKGFSTVLDWEMKPLTEEKIFRIITQLNHKI